MRKPFQAATLAAILFLGSVTSGCYGPFNATRNLWHFNGTIEGKWGQEAIFLAFSIIPVYAVFFLGDVLIFNSIQFWGGENPIKLTADTPNAELDHVAALVGLPVEITTLPAR